MGIARFIAGALIGGLAIAAAGCCAGPCRFWENAYGFTNPEIDTYAPGPPPPVTTPPGYTTPAVLPPPAAVSD